MKLALIVTTLVIVELLCRAWGSAFTELGMFNLYTNMMTFMMVDIITIIILSKLRIRFLTVFIQVILCLSVINHTFGGFCWVSYNDLGLSTYDVNKELIFYLEILAFIGYGIYRGGKRFRTLGATIRLNVLRNYKNCN